MPRLEFPAKVRLQIVNRAMQEDGKLACEGCGQILGMKSFEIDHTIPEGLRDHTMKRAALTAADGKLLGRCCHAPKTRDDVSKIRKADRIRARHLGLKKPSKSWVSPYKRKLDGTTVRRSEA